MRVSPSAPKRRGVLKHALAGAAGFLGIAAAARTSEASILPPPPQPAAAPAAATTVTFYSPYLQVTQYSDSSASPVSPPQETLFGELYDSADSSTPQIGEFRSLSYPMPNPFGATNFSVDAVQFQVFSFNDGTQRHAIYGMGSFVASDEGGWFAVTGGTGKYLGVQGRYKANLSLRRFGGEQSANFVFDLVFPAVNYIPSTEKQ